MNLIILQENELLEDGTFRLGERKFLHIRDVLKASHDTTFKAGIFNSKIGTCKTLKIEKDHLVVSFIDSNEPVPKPILSKVTVISALQRPQTIKKILQVSAACGVSEIKFFPADKSEKSYYQSPIWDPVNLENEIVLGLEQGRRIHPPVISKFYNKYEVIVNPDKLKIILDFNAPLMNTIESELKSSAGVELLLGPESGFTPEDRSYFVNKGFTEIRLSENILRSENALVYALSQVELFLSK